MLLTGKTAVISGAASPRGIGLSTARLFAEHGARIAILDLREGTSKDVAATLPGEADVALDVLVNNAGITPPIKFLDIQPENYEAVLDVSLRGMLYLSQAVIPSMRAAGGGSIVNMSSVSAQRGGGIFGGPHYSAAKAGVLGLAKAMAREFGPDRIRVNCITPGLIQTDITGGKLTDAMRTEIVKGIPLGRLGDAADVAGACLFLASDLSSYLTGTAIDVNGGMLIHG